LYQYLCKGRSAGQVTFFWITALAEEAFHQAQTKEL
jgi:hypothetical protein